MHRKFCLSALAITIALGLLACSDQDSRTALGTLERDRVALTATANELVIALPVAEGQWVQAGQLLVQLDPRQQSAQVDNASGQLGQAQANMTKLINGARIEDVEAARARFANAEAAEALARIEYQRIKPLADQQLASKNDRDQALARLDEASANRENFRQQLLELVNGTRIEDLEQGAAEVAAARANVNLQSVILDKLSVFATRDGWLDTLPWNLGERVTTGSPVAILLAGGPYARIYVPEPLRAEVSIGDMLPVHVDGVAKTFTGRLAWISTEPAFTPYFALNREERTRLVYLAEVRLGDDARALPSGVPVQVILPESSKMVSQSNNTSSEPSR
ncbi:Uncharacterised protein [BD1-7 clade bacterium]|uniref:YbhG-like alpha-helical hairpin domain-containing protein n=1 Tax=BD1-7 clade bacterium TaxID=2029982 RepID=A0A5S9QYU4_9GAMM|nr:Uncharacterised protein [BD1-7 clade bacterium]